MDIVSALKTYLRVVETGSFSAAAVDLGLTQPAVSRQVSALEAHFSSRFLHRTTNALALTAEGERMIPLALKVIEAVDALGETADREGAAASGKVRLSVPAPLGLYLSDRLPALLDAHPRLQLELIFRGEPSDLVAEAIDLEVRLGDAGSSGLICRRIGWTTAFLVASPDYLKRRGAPRSPEDLPGHDCMCYDRGGNGRSWRFSNGADDIAVRVAPRLVANNPVAVHRAALMGGGLAILSHIFVNDDIEAGRLTNVMPGFPPLRLPINVVYPSRRNLPLRVRTVLDFMIDVVRQDALMASAG
ncbi:LysR family transcriptional regulator [Phreatobacter sp. AB_2022a]|uniref:LysR family transcriptional regulator n=1 Tax=Phreatobacter sp. AB_2022a TaxID=3003134 RepID=UPI0022873BC0|nr:LysR family transcriptional regulator [Phreatobacter sp. AB_2022a]MCZ0737921.1 LysR family transcriptional regulator [Phreatobacter sp. AB_2022a]